MRHAMQCAIFHRSPLFYFVSIFVGVFLFFSFVSCISAAFNAISCAFCKLLFATVVATAAYTHRVVSIVYAFTCVHVEAWARALATEGACIITHLHAHMINNSVYFYADELIRAVAVIPENSSIPNGKKIKKKNINVCFRIRNTCFVRVLCATPFADETEEKFATRNVTQS